MSPEGYELVLLNWAKTKLYDRDLDQTGIRNVNLTFGHTGGCYGHQGEGEDSYCECDSPSPYIDATIFYFNGTKKCLYHTEIYTDIDAFLKEVLECLPS